MKLDPKKIKEATDWSKLSFNDFVKRVEEARNDVRKERRLTYQECKTCFYFRSTLATQAFVRYTCQCCGVEKIWGNGRNPRICPECGKENQCCIRCLAKV